MSRIWPLALLSLVLARPSGAVTAEAPAASFPETFAGMTARALAQEPSYASAMLGALDANVAAIAASATPERARDYLAQAAGVADPASARELRSRIATSYIPADRAAALLATGALARPDELGQALDALEKVRPGLGRAVAGVFAKADGPGDRRLVAALRAAGRREPQNDSLLYGRELWGAVFDGSPMESVGPSVSASAPGIYGPDGKVRGSGLLPRIPETLELKGKSIALRTPTDADVPSIREIFSDPKTMESLPFMTRDWTDAEVRARFGRVASAQRAQTMAGFSIVDRATGRVVGSATLKEVDLVRGTAEFGLILHRGVWGTGVASEAHKLAFQYAFDALKLKRVEMQTFPDNVRMRGFLEGIGMRAEAPRTWRSADGAERDVVVYSVGRPEASAVLARLDRKIAAK